MSKTGEGENSAVSTTSKGRKQERLGRRGGYVRARRHGLAVGHFGALRPSGPALSRVWIDGAQF
jgi:hypothetical protein